MHSKTQKLVRPKSTQGWMVQRRHVSAQSRDLQVALDMVAKLWATVRCGEKQAREFTHKLHCLLVHVPKQIRYLGRFGPFLEDPIERLHKDDKSRDRMFQCIRNYLQKEEAKRTRENIGRNPSVKSAISGVAERCKRKYSHFVEMKRMADRDSKITDTQNKRQRLLDVAAKAYEHSEQ